MPSLQTLLVLISALLFATENTRAAENLNTENLNAAERPPNIIFILADDLGYGDLGCYAQTKIKTPVLDSLAAEGIRFTRHYAGSAVCAPSRAVLLTGLHSGNVPIRDNREAAGEGQFPLPEGTHIFPQNLQSHGYVCGLFGKWGLGAPDSCSAPLKMGFERFFGYNCQRAAHTFYPQTLWDDDKIFPLNEHTISANGKLADDEDANDAATYRRFVGENYSADAITREVLRFVETNRERPFFLHWTTTVPHLALQVPEDSLAEYVGQEYGGQWDDPPYRGGRGYLPHHTPRAAYAAMITRMDKQIGELIETLRANKILDDTIIIFTSDNGPAPEGAGGTDTAFFNSHGGLRDRKGSLYEGGVRVPCIVFGKGIVKTGAVSDFVSGFEDWSETILDLTSGYYLVDEKRISTDGVSLAPILRGESRDPRQFLYREFPGYGGQQAIWSGDFKAIRTGMAKAKNEGKTLVDVPLELYNLRDDPAEKKNIAAENPEIIKNLEAQMRSAHKRNDTFLLPLVD